MNWSRWIERTEVDECIEVDELKVLKWILNVLKSIYWMYSIEGLKVKKKEAHDPLLREFF